MSSTRVTFSPREITEVINNAIVFAKAPARLGVLEDKRLAKLYEYATALFEPLWSEIDNEYLQAEEAVLICLAGALTAHLKYIVKTDKVPAVRLINPLMVKKKRKV